MTRRTGVLQVGDQEVQISALDKVLYPATGFTQGDVINDYKRHTRFTSVALQI